MLATPPPPPQKSWECLIPLEHEPTLLGILSVISLCAPGRIDPFIVLANEFFTICILKQKSAFHDTFIYFSKISIPCSNFSLLLKVLQFPA